ncbi:hypothetical protein Glove_325g13 [Diversispora epigaea]|uniref:Uncharacterized protein n=1 Tax=Diversispora epigaea TaxID=1348612 RepID=A0A397HML8_9GLOM|nr:hypothetical protein Glove_325g13 [Diversispora epigaea]
MILRLILIQRILESFQITKKGYSEIEQEKAQVNQYESFMIVDFHFVKVHPTWLEDPPVTYEDCMGNVKYNVRLQPPDVQQLYGIHCIKYNNEKNQNLRSFDDPFNTFGPLKFN